MLDYLWAVARQLPLQIPLLPGEKVFDLGGFWLLEQKEDSVSNYPRKRTREQPAIHLHCPAVGFGHVPGPHISHSMDWKLC